jgi:GMP synthase (glutamine-hydrolysing)
MARSNPRVDPSPGSGGVLVVQNDADKPLGRLRDPLLDAGVRLDVRSPDRALPSVRRYDGLIVLPGLSDPVDDHDAIGRARAVIDDAIDAGLPVLGLCLGGQLLAQALGGGVRPCRPELGFGDVIASPAADRDPLLGGVPERFSVFHAHAFAFDPPVGAEILLTNDVSVQACRYGETWAFQCHPEVSRGWVAGLAAAMRGEDGGVRPATADFFRRNGVVPEQLDADAEAAEPRLRSIGQRIAWGFAQRMARAGSEVRD